MESLGEQPISLSLRVMASEIGLSSERSMPLRDRDPRWHIYFSRSFSVYIPTTSFFSFTTRLDLHWWWMRWEIASDRGAVACMALFVDAAERISRMVPGCDDRQRWGRDATDRATLLHLATRLSILKDVILLFLLNELPK